MSDEQGTGDPAQANQTSQQNSQAATPPGYVEAIRLTNALQKIEQLTLANRSLTEQLQSSNQLAGQAETAKVQKETEFTSKVGEFQTQLQTLQAENAALKAEVGKYAIDANKIKALQEIGRTDLVPVMDALPYNEDFETMKVSIKKLADFSSQAIEKREQELLAGVTKAEVTPRSQSAQLPTDEKGWADYVNSLPLGSKERQDAFSQWHAQLMKPKS
jgi:hypothetical protein